MREVPRAGELQCGQAVRIDDRSNLLELFAACLDPAGWAERPVIALWERVVGFDVVEVLPAYDPSQITSLLAANIAYEFISLIALGKK